MKKPLNEFLQQTLSHQIYMQLDSIIGVSPKKLTRLLNGVDEFNFKNLKPLLYLLHTQYACPPWQVFEMCRFSNNITLDQMDEINALHNQIENKEIKRRNEL